MEIWWSINNTAAVKFSLHIVLITRCCGCHQMLWVSDVSGGVTGSSCQIGDLTVEASWSRRLPTPAGKPSCHRPNVASHRSRRQPPSPPGMPTKLLPAPTTTHSWSLLEQFCWSKLKPVFLLRQYSFNYKKSSK